LKEELLETLLRKYLPSAPRLIHCFSLSPVINCNGTSAVEICHLWKFPSYESIKNYHPGKVSDKNLISITLAQIRAAISHKYFYRVKSQHPSLCTENEQPSQI
jgi:hypothetical protein